MAQRATAAAAVCHRHRGQCTTKKRLQTAAGQAAKDCRRILEKAKAASWAQDRSRLAYCRYTQFQAMAERPSSA